MIRKALLVVFAGVLLAGCGTAAAEQLREQFHAFVDGLTDAQRCAYYEGPKRLGISPAESLRWDFVRDACAGIEWTEEELAVLDEALGQEGAQKRADDLRRYRGEAVPSKYWWKTWSQWEKEEIEAELERLGITKDEWPTALMCSLPNVLCIGERDRRLAAAFYNKWLKQSRTTAGDASVLRAVLVPCIKEYSPRATGVFRCALRQPNPEAAKSNRKQPPLAERRRKRGPE